MTQKEESLFVQDITATIQAPKYKARFWSCKFWEKGKSVTDLMKG